MSRQSEILNITLEAVNKNNAITVSFSNRERIIIKNMMEQYAKECSQASLEKASETAQMNFHDGHFKTNTLTDYFMTGADSLKVSKESITNPENIIIL